MFPSPIQNLAIPEIIGGNNLVAMAKNGTGKTASYAIPLLDMADPTFNEIQSLVLVPTR